MIMVPKKIGGLARGVSVGITTVILVVYKYCKNCVVELS